MLVGKIARLKACLFMLLIIDDNFNNVETLEPITTGFAIGTAVITSAFFAGYDKLKCHMYECCDDNWIRPNITGMTRALRNRLHGQHLVLDTVVKAVRGHTHNQNPAKALVLSFHGWTGGGKNFVSNIIAEHLYDKGMKSTFVHQFVSTLHFPHESKLETYKDQLRDWIKGNVSECPRSMFVFDEVDKMPQSLLDIIKPYLDHYPDINGVDYRKAIFIFLSNTGGTAITHKSLDHWTKGYARKDITHKEMEELLTLGAFNEKGGLRHSALIDRHLVSAFVPFLPMERQHVKLCIQDDLRVKGHAVTEEILSKVANELQYFPADTRLYSKSGCKRVSQKVDLVLEEMDPDAYS